MKGAKGFLGPFPPSLEDSLVKPFGRVSGSGRPHQTQSDHRGGEGLGRQCASVADAMVASRD